MTLPMGVIFVISAIVIIYHHVIYPWLLRYFSTQHSLVVPVDDGIMHRFIFIIPVCNEADFIVKKIDNLAALDYPHDRYEVWILNDGSTDKTLAFAQLSAKNHPSLRTKIKSFPVNRGKVALFNEVIPAVPDDCILFFSDASSTLSINALRRANAYFHDPRMGVVGTKYQLEKHALEGEKYYWNYQSKIKMTESRLGSPMGYHGSGYAMRRILWRPLPANAINDDFIMPLKAVGQGFLGVYDEKSVSTEHEASTHDMDWNRRIRIARGNIQQVGYLLSLLSPRHGFVAWMFFSGKVLRITMPWFLLCLFITSGFLAVTHPYVFLPVLFGQLLFYSIGLLNNVVKTRPSEIIAYFIKGHCTSIIGWFTLFTGYANHPWTRAKKIKKVNFIHPWVSIGKWIIDKIGSVLGLIILVLFLPVIALMIKISSPGPVFYKQIRVGRGTEQLTRFFYLYKFRTMHLNLEKNGPQWTQENDPRIFPFGHWLRKTHLDELPQFFNILIGDMSIVGPRPERPSMYPRLEKNIPFYAERLYGILPGLTGPAQVTYRYDKNINDVRRKVALDHAYATWLTKPWVWIKADMRVLIKTLVVVFLRKGH